MTDEWWKDTYPDAQQKKRRLDILSWTADFGDVKLRTDSDGVHVQVHPGHRFHMDRRGNGYMILDEIPCKGCAR